MIIPLKIQTINIRGEVWIIDLVGQRLINLRNKRKIKKMNFEEVLYYQELIKKIKPIEL